MPWTDEMIEKLKKMWDEGLSTGEIGKRLGVTKNSIVGKVHRLQLVARPSPIKKKGAPSDNKKPEKEKAKPTIIPETKVADKAPKKEEKPVSKTVSTPVQPKVEPKPQAKPIINTPNTTSKLKDPENFVNMSIPVMQTPKKPGDKLTVTDLDNHTCRWPIGDPKDENFHFCGAPVRIGQTYCEEHAAVAYVKNLRK